MAEEQPTPSSGGGRRGRRESNLPRQGLTTNRFSMRIPANHDAEHTVADAHGQGHWKVSLLRFIHSEKVQFVLMGLLVIDVLILFVELYLVGEFPPCVIIERDAISCCPAGAMADHEVEASEHGENGTVRLLRFLAESVVAESHKEEEHHSLCPAPLVESHDYEATCDPHKYTSIHTLEKVLFAFTISILSLFMMELLALIFILGPAFFRQGFYVLDFVIVGISLGLEISFAVIREEYLVALAGILLFGRIWRFVRIGHGIIEVTAEFAAKDKKLLLEYAESLEKILLENKIPLPTKSEAVRQLEEHLMEHGIGGVHDAGKESNH